MKNILVLFFLSLSLAYSQDTEPTSWEFIWGHSTTPRPFDNDSSKQESIMTGFQWGGSSQMNNALFNNLSTGSNYTPPTEPINTTTNLIFQPTWLGSTGYSPGYFKAVMMQYEPTLPLDGTNEGTILRPDDPSEPIFGFRYRNGRILTDTTDDNYSRIVLEKDSSYTGGKVLDDIWPQPNFDSDEKGGQTDSYKGKLWYLTINLRRLKPSIETTKDNSVILSIKMPYLKWNSTADFIKFNKIPSNISNDTVRLNSFEDRGIAQKMILIDPAIDSVAITRNMLPVSSDGYENITISAEFITNGNPLRNNIFSRDSTTGKEIKEFDIEVNYFGHTDVAIDYIRVENVRAHHLLRGKFDSLGTMHNWPYRDKRGNIEIAEDPDNPSVTTQVNTIKDIIQSTLDTLKIETSNWADAELFRFQFQDTENKSYYWWGTLRYCNKFSNGMFMTRDVIRNPKLYYYYTKSPNKWLGIGFGGSDRLMPAPYARHSNRTYDGMKLEGGFSRIHNGYAYKDTLSSEYETQLLSLPGDTAQWSDLERDSYYFDTLFAKSWLTQVQYEGQAYEHYYKNNQLSSFLYSDNPWWFYGLFHNFKMVKNADSDSVAIYDNYRVKTAEEYRLIASSALIMGCKGFINDGDQNKRFPDIINSVGSLGIGDHNKLPANELLSDSVGTDFVNAKYNTWNAWNYIDLERTAQEMEIDTSRIYIGTKSMRAELFEQHSFIRANDNLLMNLRLASAMSKGFRKFYTQDYDNFSSDTLMTKFINLNESNTYTTRLVKKSVFDNNLVEPFDSSFFDMTILREEGVPMDSIFYVGVINRRTDPLIYFTNPLNPSQKYLNFLSSAEFRDSCMNSPDSLVYQSYWWKRQGARRVTIPFDYKYSDTVDYKLLRISEIGSHVDSLNALWHRGEKYYDLVTDTVIGQDRSLSFNLLPGQAKILKVEVLKVDEIEGFLDNYNQTNLIGYPDPLDSNMITYHLAFYKNSIRPNDTTIYKEVHYIQSYPILKNSDKENIVWNPTTRRNISKNFLALEHIGYTNYVDCNHPAMVVRDDSLGNPRAYIVYTCKDTLSTYADSARVVEAVINVTTKAILSNKEIYKLSSSDIVKQGTPTINASANGNYLAWSDINKGIVIGFHKPNDFSPIRLDTLRNLDFNPLCFGTMLYPSFNTYSHIDVGEDNAGLVWYQVCPDSSKGIYYSRISFDDISGTLMAHVPNTYEGYFSFIYSPFQNMIQIDTVSQETKPIIYRNLIPYSLSSPPNCTFNRIDNINWIDRNNESLLLSPTIIKGITLYHRDINNVNVKWKSSRYRKILFTAPDATAIIKSINSAQQDGLLIDTTYVLAGGDYNLDYTVDNAQIYQIPSNNGSVNFSSNGSGVWDVNYKRNASRKASEGKNVQLAKTPEPNFSLLGKMWKNRRVFETSDLDSLDNPIIKTSANLFYKTYENEVVNHGFFGFSGDSNNVYFDLPKLEGDFGEVSSLNVQFEGPDVFNPCNLIFAPSNIKDTILTKGIVLKDYDNDGDMEMQISMFGHKNSDVKVLLERVLDSTQVELTMPTLTSFPNNSTKLIYSIIDSLNSEFKLIYINNDTTAHFNERSYFGGLESDDTVSYKSAIQKNPTKYIIDFNNGGIQYEAKNINDFELKVYPNPTSGNLRVQAFLPEKLDGYKIENRSLLVAIYDATGKKVTSQNGTTGQMFEFDLTNLSSGAYIINVEHTEGSKKYTATERIVKE